VQVFTAKEQVCVRERSNSINRSLRGKDQMRPKVVRIAREGSKEKAFEYLQIIPIQENAEAQ
jgi:hypothetical protein